VGTASLFGAFDREGLDMRSSGIQGLFRKVAESFGIGLFLGAAFSSHWWQGIQGLCVVCTLSNWLGLALCMSFDGEGLDMRSSGIQGLFSLVAEMFCEAPCRCCIFVLLVADAAAASRACSGGQLACAICVSCAQSIWLGLAVRTRFDEASLKMRCSGIQGLFRWVAAMFYKGLCGNCMSLLSVADTSSCAGQMCIRWMCLKL
jgi:hypothetical protein